MNNNVTELSNKRNYLISENLLNAINYLEKLRIEVIREPRVLNSIDISMVLINTESSTEGILKQTSSTISINKAYNIGEI